MEEYKEIADFYENEQPWLFIAIYGMNLLVINNSNLVVYHEQSGKTTCLTDPLFDFTHRLTWQEEEGSRVKTVSQATAHEDDVLRIEENGLRVGRILYDTSSSYSMKKCMRVFGNSGSRQSA